MKCPICKGKGEIKEPPMYRYDYVEAKRKMKKHMRAANSSGIGRFLNS